MLLTFILTFKSFNMSNVKITPSKEGNLVTAYSGNPEFGYILLSQTKSAFQAGWLREVTNRCIMKGSVKALQSFVSTKPTLELEGNLVVQEYVESAVPEAVKAQHFDSSLSWEEQISSYIKRAGAEGPALKAGEERILRFTVWDQSGTMVDSLVDHTNGEEVKRYNASLQANSAELPQ
jgi:fructose 1,6-bisphosphatase